MAHQRVLLLPVDDSVGSEKAFTWTLENMYREGDLIHLFHVIPNVQSQSLAGAALADVGECMINVPDADAKTQVDKDRHQIAAANAFIQRLFTSKLQVTSQRIPVEVEITHYATDKDSIGQIVCARAEALLVPAIIMAKHSQSAIREFFTGSVTSYVVHHSKQPVIIIH